MLAPFTTADASAVRHDRTVDPPGTQADAFTVDSKYAAQVLWRYSRCVVIDVPEKVDKFLVNLPWRSDSDNDNYGRKSFIVPKCLGVTPDGYSQRLAFNLGHLQAFLAETSLTHRYDKEWPDYSRVERVFTVDLIEGNVLPLYKAQFLLLSFAECVFRNERAHSQQLFATMPLSNEETAVFASLEPMLSACAPNNPGEQIKFSRLQLRGLLAEAAYEIDRIYREGIKPSR